MAPPESEGHNVRRVVLPSGREIDVVHFASSGVGGPAGERVAPPERAREEQLELHVCRNCDSELVHPIDWEQAGRERWLVSLRCPNCEWSGSGVFAEEAVDRFDDELERGSEALMDDLERMTLANMVEHVERFVAALHADALLPIDF